MKMDNRVKIIFSKGNSKLGPIWNYSTYPMVDCNKDAILHCGYRCYAYKSLAYKSCADAWANNSKAFRQDMPGAFEYIKAWFDKVKPKHFRLHVGGDFINQGHVNGWFDIAKGVDTSFLAFTKQPLDYSDKPKNIKLFFSQWPLMEVWGNSPKAWLNDDPRQPKKGAYHCKGKCSDCLRCFNLPKNNDIVFPLH
jgi:hypothetical protein